MPMTRSPVSPRRPDILARTRLLSLLQPIWDAPDATLVTITDEQYFDLMEFWDYLKPASRLQRTATCRAVNVHEYVRIEGGGRVCRRCCQYQRRTT